jgi:hypothetical protein
MIIPDGAQRMASLAAMERQRNECQVHSIVGLLLSP